MMQIFQDLSSGKIIKENIPIPKATSSSIVAKSIFSLVSIGTEKMLVDFAKSNILQKVKKQPEKVKEVLNKLKADGVLETYEAVSTKLNEPIPLGYSNVGKITEIGPGVSDFKVGDRIVTNGPHAQYVKVKKLLAAKVPSNVSDEEAAFTVIGSISLQSIRLLDAGIGSKVVVFGAGLVGNLAAQLLLASGCKVLVIDFDKSKLEILNQLGCETHLLKNNEDPVNNILNFTSGIGADGVIIAASTSSSELISQAARSSRKRGKIVLVGVSGLNLKRDDFYEKELTFQVSCSYGPGRYDNNYEEKSLDYPISFVRWTEQRNFEAFLGLVSDKKINLKILISNIYDFENIDQFYEGITNDRDSLAVLIKYSNTPTTSHRLESESFNFNFSIENSLNIGFIGAGNYTKRQILPAIKRIPSNLIGIASPGGVKGRSLQLKYGFKYSTSDYKQVLSDKDINTVFVTTPHSSHASYVIDLLNNGKNVFVEKPLALKLDELKNIKYALNNSGKNLTVGFNRRKAPFIQSISNYIFAEKSPTFMLFEINSGPISSNHWSSDIHEGGGRIIGEICHHIDLARFIADSNIIDYQLSAMDPSKLPNDSKENYVISIAFANGSVASINYYMNGSKSLPKENLKFINNGSTFVINNFKKLIVSGTSKIKNKNLLWIDKGQNNFISSFVDSLKNSIPLIPYDELFEVAEVCINLSKDIDG